MPLHMVEIESEGSSNGTGATAVVGTTQYFRLKDKRGYALILYLCATSLFIWYSCSLTAIQTPPFPAIATMTRLMAQPSIKILFFPYADRWIVAMRRSKEWNVPLGKKPAVFVLDVAEVPNLPTAPSSSSVSLSSKTEQLNSQETLSVLSAQKFPRDQPDPADRPDQGTGTGTGAAPAADDRAAGSNVSLENDKKPSAPLVEQSASDQIDEDSPHNAWYRIIYKVRKIFIAFRKDFTPTIN